jgi:anti-anti-sigma factor
MKEGLFSCRSQRLWWQDDGGPNRRGNRGEAAGRNGASPAVAERSGPSAWLVRQGPHQVVAVLAGEHDAGTLPLLHQVLAALSADSSPLVVIDLTQVTFIDAAALHALIAAGQVVTGRGGRFGLLPGTAPAVLRLLDLTGWLHHPCVITAENAGSWECLAIRVTG